MWLLVSTLSMLLSSLPQVPAQNFSGFAHDCQETGYNGDYSAVLGINCAFDTASVADTFPKQSALSLDNCLSFDNGSLTSHAG